MSHIPLLVSLGGINGTGRSLGYAGYKAHVFDQLNEDQQQWTLDDLRKLTKNPSLSSQADIDANTGIREILAEHFDYKAVPTLKPASEAQKEALRAAGLDSQVLVPSTEPYPLSFASQIPTGFDPASLYSSRNHPRGLAMTVFAASEAILGMGVDLQTLRKTVAPNRSMVLGGSALGQVGELGVTNHTSGRARGKKVSPRTLPFGLAQSPADFISAYVMGNLGITGHYMGACSTVTYQLKAAIDGIKNGSIDYAVVGASEAPILPDIIDGFTATGGTATDKKLLELQASLGLPTDRLMRGLACRPFGDNIGLVVGESSQYFVIMSDALAMETGANILGVLADSCINADGYKSSLLQPGAGNYLSLGYCLQSMEALDPGGIHASALLSHGTGTPMNRTTESDCLSKTAIGFGIDSWPVVSLKGKLGHSMAVASGDSLAYGLGMMEHGILPGVMSTDSVADDVYQEQLNFIIDSQPFDKEQLDWVVINSKGFGGNNGTCAAGSSRVAHRLLKAKYSQKDLDAWRKKNEAVSAQSQKYLEQAHQGNYGILYNFKKNVIDGEASLTIKDKHLTISDPEGINDIDVKF